MNDLGTRDMIIGAIAISLICFGGWLHHTIGTPLHDEYTRTAIANAVASFEPSPLNCKDNEMLETVKGLAENGIHLDGYQLHLKIGNFPDADPWN